MVPNNGAEERDANEAKESGDKELVITDIGGHGQAKYADLQSYFTHVFSFHNKYIQNKGNQLSLT